MWKNVLLAVQLLLLVAAIVLLGLSVARQESGSQMLLIGGVLCSSLSLCLNAVRQRLVRKE